MKIFVSLISLTISLNALTQDKISKEVYYYFDKEHKLCNEDSAIYFSYVEVFDDTMWQWNNYHMWGSLISIETYKDEKSTTPNGYFGYFNRNGELDSCGSMVNGLRNGKWLFFEDSIKPQLTRDYVMGKLIKEERQSVNNQKLKRGEKEASFPNGDGGWSRYLERYFSYPERALNKEITGRVLIFFVVNENGKIESPFISKSVEFSIDKKAMQLINNSPDWIPAQQKGKNVKAYRIQPISFVLI